MAETAKTSASQDVKALPTRVVPPIELPASAADLAREAAAQFGWQGTVLPEMKLLGRRVTVVAELRPDVHAERICFGVAPVTDRATVSTWTWPEFTDSAPSPAVEIRGVLSVARHWRTGLASVVPFARYGDTAMVLPAEVAFTDDYVTNCLPRARTYGVAIGTAEEGARVETDLAGRSERLLLDEDAVSRWVNELVYEQLLATVE
ncbi:hypothetical protein [Tamaricihabitans halophyticus]|uniref:hypothetical protein n=1 Tax=Tamaricihabitans halophyticus TaxID=1262583 RepID=UPI001044D04C